MNGNLKYYVGGIIATLLIVGVFCLSKTDTKFGAINTTGVNDFYTATMSSTTPGIYATSSVLAANSNRQYARITNVGAGGVYLGLGNTVTIYTGIYLATGSSYEINPLNLYKGAITAIATTSTTTLSIVEK
jgi:hypothetical protein